MSEAILNKDIIISVNNLTKKFGSKTVLKDFSIDIHSNQIIGLIGPNGSGKTTFFKMCTGVENLNSGTLLINGGNPATDSDVKMQITYSSCQMPIGKNEKLGDVIKYHSIAYPNFDDVFANKLMDVFGLNSKSVYKSLSQGMKSMFHFLCALATRSPLTLLDEPFNGMDIEKRKLSYEILLRDYCENPRTFIISSHNLEEMESILSEMILINNNSLIFYEDIDTVREMYILVDGTEEKINDFKTNLDPKDIVKKLPKFMNNSKIVIKNNHDDKISQLIDDLNLSASKVSPEDVCIYLTGKNSADKIDALWEEK